MPTAVLEPVAPPPLESVPHKKWTRAEIQDLTCKGFFAGEHYELIDGELINKMGKFETHVNAVLLIQQWLVAIFGFLRVRKEEPIRVAADDDKDNEPEPDLVVLREPSPQMARRPQPKDILLAIEVADSTLRLDRTRKAELYARADIPDYWILDLQNRRMIVHRDPIGGKYTSIIAYAEHESVSPLAAPQSEFRVGAAFAPTAER